MLIQIAIIYMEGRNELNRSAALTGCRENDMIHGQADRSDINVTNVAAWQADMAELADALDLGSSGRPCRFKSCYPHKKSAGNQRFLKFMLHFVLHSLEKWSFAMLFISSDLSDRACR